MPVPVGQPAPSECPFCGSCDTALGSRFGGEEVSHFVMCRRCGAQGPQLGEPVQCERAAIGAWNMRHGQHAAGRA